MAKPPIKIAIIGGGPGGTMLARLLLSSATYDASLLSVTIFEAEISIDIRSQGGSLDLHPKTGLTAIKAAGLESEFLAHARYDGAAVKICDKKAKEWLKVSASTNGKPEIDRVELRRILLDSLPKGIVKGGKKLVRITTKPESGDTGTTINTTNPQNNILHFEDGSTETGFDLIVGADGAWSRVRYFLDPSTKPTYSGLTRWWSSIPCASTTAPATNAYVARGSVFTFSDGKAIMGQQIGDGSIQVAAIRTQDLDLSHETLSVKEVLDWYGKGEWDAKLTGMIEACSSSDTDSGSGSGKGIVKPLWELPVGYTWSSRPGITLLGDAAHLMTPFAGEGVNLAFDDAMSLSRAIISSLTTLPSSSSSSSPSSSSLQNQIKTYEQNLWKRSKKAMTMTHTMKTCMFFTPGAPGSSIERYLVARLRYDVPSFFYPLVVLGVYVVYGVYRMFN